MGKTIFLSFADRKMQPSLNRIRKEAENTRWFDEIIIWNDSDLPKWWRKRYKNELKMKRFFGYTIWKPFIIKTCLERMNDGDILLYSDAGNTINIKGEKRFYEYINHLNKSICGMLVFQQNNLLEKNWTKADLLSYVGWIDNPKCEEFLNSGQYWDGCIFFRKCKESVECINKWIILSHEHHYLTTDVPSEIPNFPDFVEHRHDQSAFSCLAKPYHPYIIDANETWTQSDFNKNLTYTPIWATRKRQLTWWYLKKEGLKKRLNKIFRR